MKRETDLRLSSQRALWGAITVGLRAVSIEQVGMVIKWRCIFESEKLKQEFWEELSCAATEVVANFSLTTIDEEYMVIPNHIKMEHLEWLVFLRYEQ